MTIDQNRLMCGQSVEYAAICGLHDYGFPSSARFGYGLTRYEIDHLFGIRVITLVRPTTGPNVHAIGDIGQQEPTFDSARPPIWDSKFRYEITLHTSQLLGRLRITANSVACISKVI